MLGVDFYLENCGKTTVAQPQATFPKTSSGEPEKTVFEKEHHLPCTSIWGFKMLVFGGVFLMETSIKPVGGIT